MVTPLLVGEKDTARITEAILGELMESITKPPRNTTKPFGSKPPSGKLIDRRKGALKLGPFEFGWVEVCNRIYAGWRVGGGISGLGL